MAHRKSKTRREVSEPLRGDAPLGAGLCPLPVYCFDARAGAWAASEPSSQRAPPSALTVVTYNVLLSRPGEDGLDATGRTRRLFEVLERAQADLIALQEVTPPLLTELLAQPWVRGAYCVSDSPAGGTVTPYGLLVLSRVPFARLSQHRFTRDKRVLVAEFDTAAGRLALAVVHLMSDMASGGEILRAQHLDVLLDEILGPAGAPGAPSWLVLGDFNFGDDGPGERLAHAGLVDVWRALRPGEPGATFDPARNRLAALTSALGRPRRLDRVLLRDAGAGWVPREIALLGEEDPPSDHYGLRCGLERATSR
jgi:poly(A) polymerase